MTVTATRADSTIVLEVAVAARDVGRLLGTGRANLAALLTLTRSLAALRGIRTGRRRGRGR